MSGELAISAIPLRLPFWIVDTIGGKTISAASRVDNVIALVVLGHGFAIGESSYMDIISIGYSAVNPNGVHLVTATGENSLVYEIAGATGSETYTISGNERILSKILDGESSSVLGSCVYSNPSSNNQEYVIMALSGSAKKVELVPPYECVN